MINQILKTSLKLILFPLFLGLFLLFYKFKPHHIKRVQTRFAQFFPEQKLNIFRYFLVLYDNVIEMIWGHLFPSQIRWNYQDLQFWKEYAGVDSDVNNQENSRANSRAICAFGIHYGPFELAYLALLHPQKTVWVMAKNQPYGFWNTLLKKIRAKSGLIFFDPSEMKSVLPKIIKEKGILALLIDQNPEPSEEWLFLGQKSAVTLKLVEWMQKQGAFVFPFAVLKQNSQIEVLVGQGEQNRESWRDFFEKQLRSRPYNFIWYYKKTWKEY